MYKVQATSFSWPRHIRVGHQSSPSLSDIPIDSVIIIVTSTGGSWNAGGVEISKQISIVAEISTPATQLTYQHSHH